MLYAFGAVQTADLFKP